MHDAMDQIAEKVARGELVEINYAGPESPSLKSGTKCSCHRYSELKDDDYVVFWNEADPDCEYIHLQSLPEVFRIKLA